MNKQTYYIKNRNTGLYWNGKDLTGTIDTAVKVSLNNQDFSFSYNIPVGPEDRDSLIFVATE
jgi:hypothetical protein